MRRNLKNLRLRAIAAVDKPCQEHAKALVIKRAPEPAEAIADVLKYICDDGKAHSFQELLAENEFSQNVWPCVDALSQSIRSIVGDTSLTGGEREAKISASVEQFLTAVREISPEVSKQLSELCGKKEGPMPKTVEELQADVTKLTGDLAAANTRADTEKARADSAETAKTAAESALETEKTAHTETKKQLATATEETIKVGDVELKKSECGEAQFKLSKALAEERTMAQLEKRAETEFRHVAGTATEKALVLKTIEGKPEDDATRKAVLAVLTSAEKMAAQGFERLGGSGGSQPTETEKAAVAKFDTKVGEIAKRDNIPRHQAMSKARTEFPEEFAAAYPEQAEQSATAQ